MKFNVNVEYSGIKLVGEIQFLLDFMLKAKKMGHSIYSFVRKQDLYDKINHYVNDSCNNKENIEQRLKQMILYNYRKIYLNWESIVKQ